jgi:hypothetical protein
MSLFNKARGKFIADVDEIRPQYQDSNLADGAAIFNSSLVRSVGPSIGATIDQLDALSLTEVGSLNELATPWYADQVLPFDIRPGPAFLSNNRSSRTRAQQPTSPPTAVAGSVIFRDRNGAHRPASRFTGGNWGQKRPVIWFSYHQWALMEQNWGREGTALGP